MEIYTNANVLVGEELEWTPNATIVVENGRIAAIERDASRDGIDLRGGLVMPAFVDAHTHIGDTAAKELGIGMQVELAVQPPHGLKHRFLQQLSREELLASIRQGLKEMLMSGIAAFGDFREGGLDGVRALREASRGLPIRPVILGRPMADYRANEQLTRRELEMVAEEADGFGISGINAFDMDVFRLMRRIARDKLVAIHVSESPRDAAMSLERYGRTEIRRAFEFEPDLMVHLTHATEEDMDEIKERGQAIAVCPRTNLLLGDGIPPLHDFYRRGIPFSIGSDNMMFSSPDMFREMDTASRVTRGATQDPGSIDARFLLRSATLTGARALNIDRDLGTVEVGKAASFLVLDPESQAFVCSHDRVSAVVHRCAPSDIAWFICSGVTVIREGRFVLDL
ncbi:Probable nucleoside deaminase (Cytosine/guanine deaminase) [Thermobacillus xylanilyticus]|uniref:Probable nucleoside deaminase (Cytosine/guanine deaminase) n=1 Tax=Thermobacillus xylanilyticus TaxID=76633 RepID=A0ABN7RT04_THEXY|nr:amidohydrolase family protein [Thermobacillus xylanilyticus]CAG5082758.1 Probable nucleoside deaminase (Cytosine/guanine deaminase) [Thermobacillus xylanilyticus]